MLGFGGRALMGATLCALTGFLGACSGDDRPPKRGALQQQPPRERLPPRTADYRATRCPVTMPSDRASECGYLTVPENRASGSEDTIELAVAIAYSTSSAARSDPVVYLEGGPGIGGIGAIFGGDLPFASILRDRDLIVFDQRGTGFSRPALGCPELDTADGETFASAVGQCAERLRGEGIDLSAYDSAENAADLETLRLALGYETWNLYGISYGSRLALTALRDQPGALRSVAIDGVMPPHEDFFGDLAPNAERAFELLFTSCAADAACDSTFPALAVDFQSTSDALTRDRPNITLDDGTELALTGQFFIEVLFRLLYSRQDLKYVPAIISQTFRGDYGVLTEIASILTESQEQRLSYGMYLSVLCADEAPFTSVEELARKSAAVAPVYRGFSDPTIFDACRALGVEAARSTENEPVVSDVPVLVTSGEFDPITPPRYGDSAAAHLSQSHVFTLRGEAHGASASPCGQRLLASFLEAPDSPDGSCVEGLGAPDFFVERADNDRARFVERVSTLPEETRQRLRRRWIP
jgi:pimeloyl-ACP methyl ester carboxylesterase